MKIYLVNDTSKYHAGSQAAIASLKHKLISAGYKIAFSTPRPLEPDEEFIRACDIMVVNGEGTLNNEATSWHKGRAASILNGLALAKQLGKKAYLINCVWQNMRPGWTDILKSLDGLSVREILSQQEMERTQGVKPQLYLDLSYSCPLDPTKGSEEFKGKEVVGFFYHRNMPRFGVFDHTHAMFKDMPHLSLGGEAEGPDTPMNDWSYIVNSFRPGQESGKLLLESFYLPVDLVNHFFYFF